MRSDLSAARVFRNVRADLEEHRNLLPDPDLRIAGSAPYHDVELATGDVRHFERTRAHRSNRILADSQGTD